MIRSENLRAAVAAGMLAPASLLVACAEEPEGKAAVKAELTCASVRSEHQEGRAQLGRRIEEMRAADKAAREAGRPEVTRNREFQQLMADMERIEGRFAVRIKECVEK